MSVSPPFSVFEYDINEPTVLSIKVGIVYEPFVFDLKIPEHVTLLVVKFDVDIVLALTLLQTNWPFSKTATPSEILIIPFIERLFNAILVDDDILI